jgi:hypothetical protein
VFIPALTLLPLPQRRLCHLICELLPAQSFPASGTLLNLSSELLREVQGRGVD